MTEVSIDNTIVQEDLADSETVTVPSGESWDVKILFDPDSSADVQLNSGSIADADISSGPPQLQTVLHAGDTIKVRNGKTRLRGWVVRP